MCLNPREPDEGFYAAAATAKSLQSCPTLCNPTDGSPPGSPVPGILQARTVEWVAISFSNAWKWKNKVKSLSRVLLLVTPWTAAHQAPLSMGFSRQEYWSGVAAKCGVSDRIRVCTGLALLLVSSQVNSWLLLPWLATVLKSAIWNSGKVIMSGVLPARNGG